MSTARITATVGYPDDDTIAVSWSDRGLTVVGTPAGLKALEGRTCSIVVPTRHLISVAEYAARAATYDPTRRYFDRHADAAAAAAWLRERADELGAIQ